MPISWFRVMNFFSTWVHPNGTIRFRMMNVFHAYFQTEGMSIRFRLVRFELKIKNEKGLVAFSAVAEGRTTDVISNPERSELWQ